MSKLKFVDFEKYCPLCNHKDTNETEEPCCECLDMPVKSNSQIPHCFSGDISKKSDGKKGNKHE